MRQLWLGAVTLIVWSTVAPLHAGVYQRVEPVPGPTVTKDGIEPLPFVIFRDDVILGLPAIQAERADNQLRNRYLTHRDQLLQKERAGQATDDDLINLSAVLIRLGQPHRVVELLTPHARKRNANFMLLANLATANFLMAGPKERGQYTQALEYLTLALDGWPKEWPGFTAEQLRWYRQAEETFKTLLRARGLEATQPEQERAGLDSLFGRRNDPLRFVGESGVYEPGKLAAAEQAKLPKDAVALVQQLLVWLPGETRLYWLYGELMAAQGDLKTAREVLNHCVDGRGHYAKELQEHRQLLNEAAVEAAAAARQISWLPESTQMIVVGTVAAVIILVLIYFQMREVFRRRAGKG